jgi:flagellar motor switch protein FliN
MAERTRDPFMNETNENIEQIEQNDTENVFSGATSGASSSPAGPLLLGVKLPIRVLLGRTQLCLKDVAQLGNGSVVELDCSPSDPVEVIVNDKVIAHGEVVVVRGNYGVRITRIEGSGGQSDPDGQSELLNLSEGLKG